MEAWPPLAISTETVSLTFSQGHPTCMRVEPALAGVSFCVLRSMESWLRQSSSRMGLVGCRDPICQMGMPSAAALLVSGWGQMMQCQML